MTVKLLANFVNCLDILLKIVISHNLNLMSAFISPLSAAVTPAAQTLF